MTKSLIVLGNGGHAKVVIDMLLDAGADISATVSLAESDPYRGIPALVGEKQLDSFSPGEHACVVAIGDNGTRLRAAEAASGAGFDIADAIAGGARISPTATTGSGTVVMNGVVVNADARIGALCIINTSATVDHDCVLGDGVHLAPGVNIAGGVTIGDGAFLGVGSAVVPGVRIGAGAIVGAGAVVVRDVAPQTTVVGVPARPRRRGR
jgi:UDP-perosamine 4-acetyltransferase